MNEFAMEHAGHASAAVSHPFNLPPGSVLTSYVPNSKSALELVSGFSLGSNTVLLVTWVLARRYRPSITRGDALIAMWFGLCGCIHLLFEGKQNARCPLHTSCTENATKHPSVHCI